MKLRVYGCRGSVPMSLSLFSRYGGNTSCILLESTSENGQAGGMIIFDAGSGLLRLEHDLRLNNPNYPKNLPFKPNILLSHLHLDHIIGLAAFTPSFSKDAGMRVFTCSRDERPLKSQLLGAFAPPYWPIAMEEHSPIECVEIFDSVTFSLGEFTITPFDAQHPNGTQSFHVTDGKKTIVHLLDNELSYMDKKSYKKLVEYCRNVDLVIFDAAYIPQDYEAKKGYGHSTIEHGIELANDSCCERMLFSHFSPEYSDSQLDDLISYLIPHGYNSRFILSRDGLELQI